jgi:integrase/recombinase XerD
VLLDGDPVAFVEVAPIGEGSGVDPDAIEIGDRGLGLGNIRGPVPRVSLRRLRSRPRRAEQTSGGASECPVVLAAGGPGESSRRGGDSMSGSTTLLPFQPTMMSTAQLAAVSYLARYSGHTHALYASQLRRWFAWCERNRLDPLIGIQRAHVELYIRHLGDAGLMDSSVTTMMHAVRGSFRFAHIDGLIPSDPAVYARLPKVHRDESRTQGMDRLELIRFLQVAQTIAVHHGALAYLLGINALRASEAAAVRIEDYADTLRGHRVLQPVGKGNKPATMPITVPVLRVLEACRGQRTIGPLILRPVSGNPIDRRDAYRMVARIAKVAGIPRHISPHSLRHAAITNALDAGVPLRDAQILARHADPRTTEHYDRARGNLDRHGVHFLTAYVAGV